MKMMKHDGVTWMEVDAAWILEQRVKDLLALDVDAIVFVLKYDNVIHYITNDEATYIALSKKHRDSIIIWMHEFIETLRLMRCSDSSVYLENIRSILKVKGEIKGSVVKNCKVLN